MYLKLNTIYPQFKIMYNRYYLYSILNTKVALIKLLYYNTNCI